MSLTKLQVKLSSDWLILNYTYLWLVVAGVPESFLLDSSWTHLKNHHSLDQSWSTSERRILCSIISQCWWTGSFWLVDIHTTILISDWLIFRQWRPLSRTVLRKRRRNCINFFRIDFFQNQIIRRLNRNLRIKHLFSPLPSLLSRLVTLSFDWLT